MCVMLQPRTSTLSRMGRVMIRTWYGSFMYKLSVWAMAQSMKTVDSVELQWDGWIEDDEC